MSAVKASVLHGPQDLRLENVDLPPPGPDEVQVAVQSTGLCGSDMHYFKHFRNGDIIVREPLILGHESSGTVVSAGPGVSSLVPGDRVALEVGVPCEACELCLSGRYNICAGMKFRSSAKAFPHFQGTLQESINHPAKWCHKLPDNIPLDLGALVEPLSVALHAKDRAALPIAPTVFVFGAGAVGLLVAAVHKASTASVVVIADIQKERIDFAIRNGYADAGVVAPPARPETLEEKLSYARRFAETIKATEVYGNPIGQVSAVYECTGAETCLQTSIHISKPGGRIMVVGMGNSAVTLPLAAAATREVDVIGVFRYANCYPAAIDLLSNQPAGMPDLARLVTQRFEGLEHVSDAFSMAGRAKDDEGNLVIKVIVDTSSRSNDH